MGELRLRVGFRDGHAKTWLPASDRAAYDTVESLDGVAWADLATGVVLDTWTTVEVYTPGEGWRLLSA